jgi:hypothetical protein
MSSAKDAKERMLACVLRLALHEIAEIEDAVHHIRILLDDVGERLGIDQCHGKLLVERIVVPIHFREPDDSCTGLMPAAHAAETTDQDRRWRRLIPIPSDADSRGDSRISWILIRHGEQEVRHVGSDWSSG